jgi:OHCU decarboxylase
MSITPPDMDRSSFIALFGAVYENAPWIAGEVYDQASGDLPNEPDTLNEKFSSIIMAAGKARQLELLRAHPELGVARADREVLTDASRMEQAGAGLDQCTAVEYETFGNLNSKYRDKHGFPFIIAVRGRDRQDILDIFRRRLENDTAEEFEEALRQVLRIGMLRIGEIMHA